MASLNRSSYIHVFTPASVGFSTPTTTFCKKPATVTFSNSSTGTPPLSYLWEFGDGATAGSTTPTHIYSIAGTYDITLVVTDGNGCKDSLVQPSYISVGSLAAGFSSTSPSCLNIPIVFTNTSTSHILSQWYFGDGGTSPNENPSYSYSVAGTYSVKLVVFDGTCYDSITHTVNILALPTGGFTQIPTQPCPPPVNVTFNASVPGGTTVAWLFGDGTTGTGPSFVKNYPLSVIDYVDMILTNPSGCKDTIQKIDTIYNLFINPSGDSLQGCVPRKVNFSMYAYSVVYNTFTSNYDFFSYPYAITSYSWNFGDGSPVTGGPTPAHTYTAPGLYTATVTITTANGCTGSATLTIGVGVPPIASFVGHPRHYCANRATYDSSTSTGAIDDYVWTFGDGYAAPHISTASHIYTAPGIYTTTLIVSDYGCLSLPFMLTDTVDSPSALIAYKFACIPDNEIDFGDSSFGDNSHLWQFGDGTTSSAFNPVHDYATLSPFLVTLTTYNSRSGCRDTNSTFVNLARPNLGFVASHLSICRDVIDTIAITSSGVGLPISQYKWYDNGVLFDSVHLVYVLRPFHALGLHTIEIIALDKHKCFDTLIKNNYILVAKPVDSFNFTPTTGCAPMPVSFTDYSTDVAGATITSYAWTFGDGATSTLFAPSAKHIYTNAGIYSVKEIVTDNIGCMDTLTSHTKITVYKPTASYTAASTSVCLHAGVHFNNTSSGIVSSLWLFGDGDTSTVTSPAHSYTATGTYTVKLVVYDSHGCTDTLTRSSYITVNPGPTASFYMNDSFAVCPPLNVHFTNTSIGATSYFWIFGDGHTLSAISPSEPYLTPGLYTVQLIATGPTGCTDTAIGHVTIFGYAGAFHYTPISGCSPLYVHFSAVLSTVASIIWDFGDGSTSGVSILDSISHIYTTPGAYVPKLILKDSSGCTSFSVGADTIKVDTIMPHFTIVPNPACVNSSVSFKDSSYSYFSASTAWLWTFGGGFTSTVSAPVHTFTTSGVFPVTLHVTDANGCAGNITKNVTVATPPPPITGVLSICKGTTSALTDGTSGTWASSNTSVAAIGSSSGIVSGVSQGTATISFTVPLGCVITTVVTIKPLPSIITGATGVCNGLTTALSDSTGGGLWTSSNTGVATIGSSSGLVSSVALGTSTIIYTLPAGCSTSTVVTITNAPLAITGLTTVCLGATSPLTDAITGGTWTSGNIPLERVVLFMDLLPYCQCLPL
jgi:PKD repeat protein